MSVKRESGFWCPAKGGGEPWRSHFCLTSSFAQTAHVLPHSTRTYDGSGARNCPTIRGPETFTTNQSLHDSGVLDGFKRAARRCNASFKR